MVSACRDGQERTGPEAARELLAAEDGLTLIELVLVVLIIGILASIGLLAMLSQKAAASDSSAKALLRSAQAAADTYSFDHGYSSMTPSGLKSVDPSINIIANGRSVLVNANPTTNGYLLTVVSSSADTYNVNFASGTVTRTCTVASGNGNTGTNTGAGCKNGTW